MRRFPMVGGIDVAGAVHASNDPRYAEGDPVVITGFGLSEDFDGGYSEYVRAPGDWLIRLPDGMSLRDSMAIGTAGFTAALAVDRMELNGQRPDRGPVLVNGATGGVGSFAIDMLAGLGYEVAAFTGKRDRDDYLRALGASRILYRDEAEMGTRPLEKTRWAGAVDNVGGGELAWLTRTMQPEGNIASIGLAGGFKLETTVMPFILRGVNLLGINSVHVARDRRERVWQRLASDSRAAPPGQDRDGGNRALRPALRVRRLHGGHGHRPRAGAHRRLNRDPGEGRRGAGRTRIPVRGMPGGRPALGGAVQFDARCASYSLSASARAISIMSS